MGYLQPRAIYILVIKKSSSEQLVSINLNILIKAAKVVVTGIIEKNLWNSGKGWKYMKCL